MSNVQTLYKSTDDNLFACRETNNELRECYSKLEKENEQLKQQIGNLEHTRDFCADVCADCERLEKENEQLKQRVEQLENHIVNKLTIIWGGKEIK